MNVEQSSISTTTMLRHVPLFSDLTDDQLQELADAGTRLLLDAGQVIFHEGDLSTNMYVILAGRVRIYRKDDSGNEIELSTLGEYDCFGEWALIDDHPRSASVATLTPCEFFVLDQQTFHAYFSRYNAELGIRVFTVLTRRLRERSDQFLQQELARQRLHAEMEIERHRALSQMVAGVAHEVNTPLGIVSTALSIVKKGLHSIALTGLMENATTSATLADMREAVDLMERNIQRAHKLIQDFKKVSVSQVSDVLESMDLSEAVAEIVGLFKVSARKAKLEIEINDTLTNGSRTWVGYRGYLSQILLNALTNVERYAYPGGGGGKVVITLACRPFEPVPLFTITVRDFGRGIPAADLPRVFEPFFTTGRSLGGTGLGLTIMHTLATGPLEGRVDLTSEIGRGTEITVTFPQRLTSRKGA